MSAEREAAENEILADRYGRAGSLGGSVGGAIGGSPARRPRSGEMAQDRLDAIADRSAHAGYRTRAR